MALNWITEPNDYVGGKGYGLDGKYGEGYYKGDTPKSNVALDILIEQFGKAYYNSATSVAITIPKIVEENVITVGKLSANGLIEQFKKDYINGN